MVCVLYTQNISEDACQFVFHFIAKYLQQATYKVKGLFSSQFRILKVQTMRAPSECLAESSNRNLAMKDGNSRRKKKNPISNQEAGESWVGPALLLFSSWENYQGILLQLFLFPGHTSADTKTSQRGPRHQHINTLEDTQPYPNHSNVNLKKILYCSY